MHVVVINRCKEDSAESVQALANALGITAYEARPRIIGNRPAVAACLADLEKARELESKLNRAGFETFIVDTNEVRNTTDHFIVRSFQFNKQALRIETTGGQQEEIPYEEVDILLSGTRIAGTSETKTIIEHKFSLGKTLLSGGIPMTSKVERQEEVSQEERGKVLYLFAGRRPPVIFNQHGLSYDGFGAEMKLSRELNFAHLTSELRRLCQTAGYDDRLLNRVGQVRLLGPTLNPETNLNLAAAILAQSLRNVEIRGSGDMQAELY